MHKPARIEHSDTEHRSEDGGNSSTHEESTGLPEPETFTSPLAVRDLQVSKADTNVTLARDLEHTVCNTDSMSDMVGSLESV